MRMNLADGKVSATMYHADVEAVGYDDKPDCKAFVSIRFYAEHGSFTSYQTVEQAQQLLASLAVAVAKATS